MCLNKCTMEIRSSFSQLARKWFQLRPNYGSFDHPSMTNVAALFGVICWYLHYCQQSIKSVRTAWSCALSWYVMFVRIVFFYIYFILQDCGVGKDDLTQIELQICVDYVNSVVQEETDREYLVFFCILALDNDEKWLSEPRPLVC